VWIELWLAIKWQIRLFCCPWKHVFPELLTWLLTTYFQRTCTVLTPRKTRSCVSSFSLACCDHMWRQNGKIETIILVRSSNVNPIYGVQTSCCLFAADRKQQSKNSQGSLKQIETKTWLWIRGSLKFCVQLCYKTI
jgi:hypothetical protein